MLKRYLEFIAVLSFGVLNANANSSKSVTPSSGDIHVISDNCTEVLARNMSSLQYWDKVKYGQYEKVKPDRNHTLAEGGRKVKVEDPKQEVKPHHEWAPYAGPVLWTGPDGDRDYRPRLFKDWQLLGIGDVSAEKTLAATYISRAPPDQPFGKPRSEQIGEIGWFYKNYAHAFIPSLPESMER